MKMEAPGCPASRSWLAPTELGRWEASCGGIAQRGEGPRDELLRRRSREGPLLIGRAEGVCHSSMKLERHVAVVIGDSLKASPTNNCIAWQRQCEAGVVPRTGGSDAGHRWSPPVRARRHPRLGLCPLVRQRPERSAACQSRALRVPCPVLRAHSPGTLGPGLLLCAVRCRAGGP